MTKTMTHTSLKRIRLELGRTPQFPSGSSRRGYEFVAPLTDEGFLSVDAWKQMQKKCTVTRFWDDEPEQYGYLRHVGKGWRFDYRPDTTDDDEPFFKLDQHALVPDNYVSVTETDGVQRPFRVVLVTPETGG